MVKFFCTRSGERKATELETVAENCWVHMENPSDKEVEAVCAATAIPEGLIKAALDEEERAHIEIEGNAKLVLVDIPILDEDDESRYTYYTLPMGIILTDKHFVTVCLRKSGLIADFTQGRVKSFDINKKVRFLYQLLYNNSTKFLLYLRQMDKMSSRIQNELHKSMKNKELIELLELQKSYVYFTTSLNSNHAVIDKLISGQVVQHFPEDKEILEDVVIENRQAMEMCNIYRDILTSTMDAFASVIGNNQNSVMKLLTIITIIISIPTLFASFWGMNTPLPFEFHPFAFWIVLGIAAVSVVGAIIFMIKKKIF